MFQLLSELEGGVVGESVNIYSTSTLDIPTPVLPVKAIEYENVLLNIMSSTVIGIFNVPFLVVIVLSTFIVIVGSLELLLAILTLIPLGIPVILPTVQFFLISPLYPYTLHVVAPTSAVVSLPINI